MASDAHTDCTSENFAAPRKTWMNCAVCRSTLRKAASFTAMMAQATTENSSRMMSTAWEIGLASVTRRTISPEAA